MFNALIRRCRRMRQRGATLLELLMYVGAVAFIIISGVVIYQQVMTGAQSNDVTRQLMSLQSSVRNLYANQNDYTDISNAVLVAANAVPRDMRVGESNNIRHALGGTVTVDQGNDPGRFEITFSNVNSDACVRLATMQTGQGSSSGIDSISVGGANLDMPISIGEATASCNNDSGRVDMVWQMF